MTTKNLLDKLVEIERALRRSQLTEALALVLESEDLVLQLERELIQLQVEKLSRSA